MKKLIIVLMLTFFLPEISEAHFGIIIPSKATVMEKSEAELTLDLAFSHPFSGIGMDMVKPDQFFMLTPEGKTDLMASLKPKKFMDHSAWQSQVRIQRPGVYQFAVIPKPYFEEAEDSFIIHYAKTVVGAYGNEDGWSEPCGLPLEIIPLSRPFGNYAGNLFSGTALLHGKPLPNALVEIENLNLHGSHKAPNPYFETQTVRTDVNGNFSFAVPWAGWWGFAVLADSPDKMDLNGSPKSVELGGIIWMEFINPVGNTQKEIRQ